MGQRKAIRYLPAQHRKIAAARVPDSLGCAHACSGRSDSRPCRIGNLSLSQGRGAQVSDTPDAYGSDEWRNSGYSAKLHGPESSLPRTPRTGPAREFPTAYASARKSDVD